MADLNECGSRLALGREEEFLCRVMVSIARRRWVFYT